VLVRQVAPGVDCAVSEMVRVSSPCSMIAPCHLTRERLGGSSKQADDDPPAGISVRDSASRGRIRRDDGRGGEGRRIRRQSG
jgi:hypothetical protein